MFARYTWDVTVRTFALIKVGAVKNYTQSIISNEERVDYDLPDDSCMLGVIPIVRPTNIDIRVVAEE